MILINFVVLLVFLVNNLGAQEVELEIKDIRK
jgi:hypothetical protein